MDGTPSPTHSNTLASLAPGFLFGGFIQDIIPNQSLPESQDPLSLMSGDALSTEVSKNELNRFSASDYHWMREALRESMKGVGITNPNPAVGCILIDAQGRELARGATQAFRGLHAERVAFSKISDPESLAGGTAYLTLEPCSHYGNQPPCVDLLVSSKLKRVVISSMDPNPAINGDGIRRLLETGKEVALGLLAAETTAWNFPFFVYQKKRRPMIALKWAQTLDGHLADDFSSSKWISGPASRAYTHWLRQRYDSILVGARTVLNDFPRLDVRDCALPHQAQPLPIILDPKGILLKTDLSTQEKLLQTTFRKGRKILFITTRDHSGEKMLQTRSWMDELSHVNILRLSTSKQDLSSFIAELMTTLGSSNIEIILGRPLQSLFIEGGPSTLSTFIRAGFFDLLHVFIAPILIGGDRHRLSLMKSLQQAYRFYPISSSRLGPDLLLELISPEHEKTFSLKS